MIPSTHQLGIDQATGLLNSDEKTVCYVSRVVAEQLIPPPGTHLISISDEPRDQASINPDVWSSVSFHHFLDGGFDVELIQMYGEDFEASYAGYITLDKAEAIRQRVMQLASTSRHVVVNCQAGRSRSAAVARWAADTWGFSIKQGATEANTTVLRMLHNDPALVGAIVQCRAVAERKHQPQQSPLRRFFEVMRGTTRHH